MRSPAADPPRRFWTTSVKSHNEREGAREQRRCRARRACHPQCVGGVGVTSKRATHESGPLAARCSVTVFFRIRHSGAARAVVACALYVVPAACCTQNTLRSGSATAARGTYDVLL